MVDLWSFKYAFELLFRLTLARLEYFEICTLKGFPPPFLSEEREPPNSHRQRDLRGNLGGGWWGRSIPLFRVGNEHKEMAPKLFWS